MKTEQTKNEQAGMKEQAMDMLYIAVGLAASAKEKLEDFVDEVRAQSPEIKENGERIVNDAMDEAKVAADKFKTDAMGAYEDLLKVAKDFLDAGQGQGEGRKKATSPFDAEEEDDDETEDTGGYDKNKYGAAENTNDIDVENEDATKSGKEFGDVNQQQDIKDQDENSKAEAQLGKTQNITPTKPDDTGDQPL